MDKGTVNFAGKKFHMHFLVLSSVVR